MCLYKLSACETVRLLSGHILPRNALNFTHSHLDFKNFPGEKPQTPVYRGGEGEGMGKDFKGFLPLNEGEGGKGQGRGERDGRGKGGRGGPATGGILLQGLGGGIDAPSILYFK